MLIFLKKQPINIAMKLFQRNGVNAMLYTGKKIKYYNKEAIVLTWLEKEVLIYVNKSIKWVDRDVLKIVQY